jgi:hypothetical protein
MRKIFLSLAISALALTGLSACGESEPVKGVVTTMDYDATTYKTVTKCKTVNGKKSCKANKEVKERENWDVIVRPDAGGEDQEIDVSKTVYDGCKVGAWFDGNKCR